jgi:hypothetical protein
LEQKKTSLELDSINQNSVNQIITGHFNPAKNLKVTELKNQFAREITIIIDAYFGATNGTSVITIQECLEIFMENYMDLSIFELKNAAKYLTFNQLQKEVKNKTFYGQFTCSLFVEMIEKYLLYRKKVLMIMREKENQEEALKKQQQKDEKLKLDFIQIAKSWIDGRKKLNDLKNYEEIPIAMAIHFGKTLPENEKLKNESLEITINEIKNQRVDKFMSGNKIKANELMFILERNNENELKQYSNSIYLRLKVFHHIKNNLLLADNDSDKIKNHQEKDNF